MIDIVRNLKQWIDRFFFNLIRVSIPSFRESQRTTVLMIRTDGIGDLVFFVPVAERISKHLPDSRFILVCRDTSASIVPQGIFDAVIPFRYMAYRWNYFYRLVILREIRRQHPAVAIYCSYHRQHIGDEMTLCSGAVRTIAFEGNDEIIHPKMRLRNNPYYSELVKAGDHISERMRYDRMLKVLGLTEVAEEAGTMRLPEVSFEEVQRCVRGLSKQGYIVIGPGGSAPIRRWPAKEFVRLGDAVAERTGLAIVLCGEMRERTLLQEIAAGMRNRPEVCSNESLPMVVQLIRSAKMFIGNESGLLHIAASSGIPAIGILGGGHFSRYFPYGSAQVVNHKLDCYECNWKCPFPEPYCLTRITVVDVMRGMEGVLE